MMLVLGAGGLMGRYLTDHALRAGLKVRGLRREELDITNDSEVERMLKETKPDWVINAAACARMEQCAENPGKTRRLNAEAPARLAEWGRTKGFRLCHVSSDYVLDGQASSPCREDAPPGPLSEYARQKTFADAAVSAYPEHLIIRVAWLFGRGGETFMSRMPDLLRERPLLRVASGRTGNCLYMGIGATWLFELIQRDASGLFNFVHPGETTWEKFAQFTLLELKRRGESPACQQIEAVPMETMSALSEPRPVYTGLSVEKLEQKLGRPLENWQAGVRAYLDEG